jgi:hypothetical protein
MPSLKKSESSRKNIAKAMVISADKRRLPVGEASFRKLMRDYKNNARRKDMVFELSPEEFRMLTSGSCYYCGRQPESIYNHFTYNGPYVYNGVDRIMNGKGYTVENCVSCCWQCNRIKGKLSQYEFHELILNIYEHMAGREGALTKLSKSVKIVEVV